MSSYIHCTCMRISKSKLSVAGDKAVFEPGFEPIYLLKQKREYVLDDHDECLTVFMKTIVHLTITGILGVFI